MSEDHLARDMYKEHILELYKDPPHFGTLKNHTHSFHNNNPLCGDDMTVQISVKDGKIIDAKFTGRGCAISTAATALVVDHAIGKKANDVLRLKKENVLELLEIPVGPVRMKCALLGLETLQSAIERGENK